jgi:type IV pilus assembly protein PilC
MSGFRYVAKDLAGQKREGLSYALSRQQALVSLREQGLIPIEITEVSADKRKTGTLSRRKRIKPSELASFCWQLCTMIEGGVPLISAIETISQDSENEFFQGVLKQTIEGMQKGETLHGSISQFPRVFDTLFCSLVMAGETGGALPSVLNRLAEYYDSKDKLMRKVRVALAYPTFVVAFLIFLIVFIMVFIIPRFKVIFTSIGGKLPLFTRMFMGVYDAIVENLLFAFLIGLAVIGGLVVYSKTERGWRRMSRIALKLPLIGRVKTQAFIAMFCKTFATLLGAGVSVLDTLDILTTMSKNAVVRDAMSDTREKIVKGSAISMSMAATGFFPRLLVKMVQVGEESGSLPYVLDRTCGYYERRVESAVATATSVLEPALIVCAGMIVLVVVIALYLPVFTISDIRQ